MAGPGDHPIGYWCKHVDELLERAVDAVLARNGLRRRHWQVMTALRERALSRAQIAEAMLPLWVAASVTQTDVVDDLVRREWAGTDGESYWLTDSGATAYARVAAGVAQLQTSCRDGVSDAEYLAAIDVLSRIAANLEGALAR